VGRAVPRAAQDGEGQGLFVPAAKLHYEAERAAAAKMIALLGGDMEHGAVPGWTQVHGEGLRPGMRLGLGHVTDHEGWGIAHTIQTIETWKLNKTLTQHLKGRILSYLKM
jgi:hypothetical protein